MKEIYYYLLGYYHHHYYYHYYFIEGKPPLWTSLPIPSCRGAIVD